MKKFSQKFRKTPKSKFSRTNFNYDYSRKNLCRKVYSNSKTPWVSKSVKTVNGRQLNSKNVYRDRPIVSEISSHVTTRRGNFLTINRAKLPKRVHSSRDNGRNCRTLRRTSRIKSLSDISITLEGASNSQKNSNNKRQRTVVDSNSGSRLTSEHKRRKITQD